MRNRFFFRQLDELRHTKEHEFATLTSHPYYSVDSADQDHQRLNIEIKFLATVGVTLLHW